MALTKINPENIYFSEPRLKISVMERMAARVIIYCVYTLLAATAVTFLLSDVKTFFWLGILAALFLAERLIHSGQADKSLFDLKSKRAAFFKNKRFNAAKYLTPGSLRILEHAMEKSLVTNNDFFLYLAKFLAENPDIHEGLIRMDVPVKEFEKKIDDLINENKKSGRQRVFRRDLTDKIGNLAKTAFGLSLNGQEKFIEPRSLFSALNFSNSEKIS